ncbi:MAG: transglycosylase SLT domain-containing protein [Deltaproteobacteria bacterium]|nr:transglycosylase SLT domain-containing protein [Deltaproteobacteria bacterium]
MRRTGLRLVCFLVLAWLLSGHPAGADTVVLPITVEYNAMRTILVHQMFTLPNERAMVLDDGKGCNYIELAEPQLGPEGRYLRIAAKIRARAGLAVFSECRGPEAWEGNIELIERVWLDPANWLLRFQTVDSRVYNPNGERTEISRLLWELIKKHVHAYLDRTTIDLAPPVAELKSFLPMMVQPASRGRLNRWLESLRPGDFTVSPEAVSAEIVMDVGPMPPAGPKAAEAPLNAEELKRFVQAWETWDAFLAYEIRSLGGHALTEDDKQALLDILLETRYRFVDELGGGNPHRDLVREQFVSVWRRLSPILRKYLNRGDATHLLGYLSFFSAADALAALDRLGPALDIEISRRGLRRLARLISAEGWSPSLEYYYGVDVGLRDLLGFDPISDEKAPVVPEEEEGDEDLEMLPEEDRDSRRPFNWLGGVAWAAEGDSKVDLQELRRWLVPEDNLAPFLKRLRALMRKATEKTLEKGRLNSKHHSLFKKIVPATAWQESCWRQFIVKDGKILYLMSYNNTSVGIMQVNERVWRGIFSRHNLRWNIWYNAQAGCQILEHYFLEYLIGEGRTKENLDPDTMARALYAMYNGGPAQLNKFLNRHKRKKYYLSDKLFWEKYTWVKAQAWDRSYECLK